MQTAADVVKEDEWHHFAAIVSASRNHMQLCINGLLQASSGSAFDSRGMRDTYGPLQLGSVARRDYFGGRLDEVQLWKRALSRAEVEQNMKQTLTGIESGLVAYYDFEELDPFGMIPDRSSNGHRPYLRNGARIADEEMMVPLSAKSGYGADGKSQHKPPGRHWNPDSYLVSQPPRIEKDLDLKKSFGFGIKLGDSRLNIARALDGDGQVWEFSA